MAKIKKIQEQGQTIYPATITQAIKDGVSGKGLEETYAQKDGDYPKMTAGFAQDIVGDGQATEEEFAFRPSGGKNRNVLTVGAASITSIKGESFVWNQGLKCAIDRSGNGKNGWWVRSESYGANGTVIGNTIKYNVIPSQDSNNQISQKYNFIQGHKYFVHFDYNTNGVYTNDSKIIWRLLFSQDIYGSNNQETVGPSFAPTIGSVDIIITATRSDSVYLVLKEHIRYSSDKLEEHQVEWSNVHLVDLTLMFGEGNEPTVEEFYNRMPNGVDINAYNAGTLINNTVSGIKTIGFNQWDEQWVLGYWSTANGILSTDVKYVSSKNPIKVIENSDYYISVPYGPAHGIYICYYDNTNTFIYGEYTQPNKVLRIPSGCGYITFSLAQVYGTSYNNDVCVNLSWDEYSHLNGTYQSYEAFTRDFSWISKYFPYGLQKVGDIKDEIVYEKANKRWKIIQRVERVNLGDLTWEYRSTSDLSKPLHRSTLPTRKMNSTFNALCNKYVVHTKTYSSITNVSNNVPEKQIAAYYGSSDATNPFYIADSDYTDATAFKEAMSGVILLYELATPIESYIEDATLITYNIQDYGTEQISYNTISTNFIGDIIYQPNALASIKQIPSILKNQDDLLNNRVNKDGHYPTLTAGFAEHILGDGSSTKDEVISLRPTAGINRNVAVRDIAVIEKLKGNSLVWNQLSTINGSLDYFKQGDTTPINYWKLYNVNTLQTLQVNNGIIEFDILPENSYQGAMQTIPASRLNDKILLMSKVRYTYDEETNGTAKYLNYTTEWSYPTRDLHSGEWLEVYDIYSNTKDDGATKRTIGCRISAHCGGGKFEIAYCYYFNLTQMFGAGNEPTTIEEFWQRLPKGVDLNAYNAGEIVDGNYEAIKTTGFNQFNGTYAKVIGGLSYHIGGSLTYVGFTDKEGGTLESVELSADGTYTPTRNDYLYAEGENINIHFNWEEYDHLNEMYAPYKPFERNLSWIKKYFPNGMRQAGSVRDEIRLNPATNKWEAVQNVGVTKIGDMTWILDSTLFFNDSLKQMAKPSSSNNVKGDLLCVPYMTDTFNNVFNNKTNKTIGISSNGIIRIYDTDYSDAASFKTANYDVQLYYALATPIITEITESVNFDYDCSDYGAEELIPNGESAPLVADIVYQPNALATVKQVPDILDRLAALEAQLASLQTATTNINEEIE